MLWENINNLILWNVIRFYNFKIGNERRFCCVILLIIFYDILFVLFIINSRNVSEFNCYYWFLKFVLNGNDLF